MECGAASLGKKIIGPIFFTGIINSEAYENVLLRFIALSDRDERFIWLRQDGARAHTNKGTMKFLREFFGNRLISTGLWPLRSPDLTPPDFFLWGALKGRVYNDNPQTIDELKAAIIRSYQPRNIKKGLHKHDATG